MTVALVSSVGLHGANQPEDVHKVHRLLNRIPRHLGGSPRPALAESGGCDVNTIVAIKRFQWRLFPQRQRPVDGLVEPRGSTLREMNRLAEGQLPIRPRPAGIRGHDIPLYITEMWHLIQENHRSNHDVYPSELLLALFWEESNFINTRGRRRSDMIGFGQVWEGNFGALNTRYGRSFTPAGVLGNNAQSVEIASLCLDNARHDGQPASSPPRDRHDSLGYYATGRAGGWNTVIDAWLRCMRMLQDTHVGSHLSGSQITDMLGVTIRECLWEARPNALSVWSPDMALPPDL